MIPLFLTLALAVPPLKGNCLVDTANVVDGDSSVSIINLCNNLNASKAGQLAVLTVNSLEGESIEAFGIKVAEAWKIGFDGTNDTIKGSGAILILAVKDRKSRIEVGYGLEGVINDGKASALLRTYGAPHFKTGKFGTGLLRISQQIEALIKQEYNAKFAPTAQTEVQPMLKDRPLPPGWSGVLVWFVFGLILLIGIPALVIWMLSRSKPKQKYTPNTVPPTPRYRAQESASYTPPAQPSSYFGVPDREPTPTPNYTYSEPEPEPEPTPSYIPSYTTSAPEEPEESKRSSSSESIFSSSSSSSDSFSGGGGDFGGGGGSDSW